MIMNKKNLYSFIFFVCLSGLWIFPAILSVDGVLFHPKAEFTDILVSHWPNFHYIRGAWNTWGEFPLWNPMILSGAPLVADPLFGVWYPPNWAAFVLPIQFAINILFWLHLAWAGIGMYKWMRAEKVGWGGALIAGIAFSATPKLIGHIALGHLGLVSAVAWTPWLLMIVRRMTLALCLKEEGSLQLFSMGGAIAAILFLADPRWILPATSLALLYGLRIVMKTRVGKDLLSFRNLGLVLVSLGIFLGFVAGLFLPMVEFTSRSTRSNLSFEELTDLSLPVENMIGTLIPNYGAWPETITFLGILVIGLAWIAILGKKEGWLFWSSIAIGYLLFALGDQNPLIPFLYKLIPGLSFLRVPARFYYICCFSTAVLAGLGFHVLSKEPISLRQIKSVRLGMVGFSGLLLILSIGSWILLQEATSTRTFPWLHMILGAIFFIILGFLYLQKKFQGKSGIILWSIAIILDLFLMNRSLLEIRSEEGLFSDRVDLRESLQLGSRLERTFSPSYSIPQHIAGIENIQLADGVNPLQLRSYWEFMAEAVGFEKSGYSVTLPPFPEDDLNGSRYTSLDSKALGLLNVGTIISNYCIESPDLERISTVDGKFIYHNVEVRPRAWIEVDSEAKDSSWQDVVQMEWSPNSIHIEARGPGKLVLSELNFPGWEATINGDEVSILPYEGLLRSVELEEGPNLVDFKYRPWTVFLGLGISIFTLILFVIFRWRG